MAKVLGYIFVVCLCAYIVYSVVHLVLDIRAKRRNKKQSSEVDKSSSASIEVSRDKSEEILKGGADKDV